MQQPPYNPNSNQQPNPFWGNYQSPPQQEPTGFYQQPTMQGYPMVPPPPMMPPPAPPPQKKPNTWLNLKTAKRSTKIGVGCGAILLMVMLCMCSAVAYAGFHPAPLTKVPPTATATPATTQIVQVATTQPTHQTAKPTAIPTIKPTDTPQPTPTTMPTQIPTTIPTAVPTTIPTQAPTQAPIPTATQPPTKTGLYGNPWGYDLNAPGNVIYTPPATICDYFPCIASFWRNTSGYVDECSDGMYSHSGGVTGACSRHGGEAQPLYSH